MHMEITSFNFAMIILEKTNAAE